MATMPLNIPDEQVPVLRHAVGVIRNYRDGNGDPRSATTEECRQEIINYLKGLVDDVHKREQGAVIPPPPTFDPT